MKNHIILGIDPGLSGGIAFYDVAGNALTVLEMPIHHLTRGGKLKREIDIVELARLVDAHGPIGHAVVERVGSMPGQGVTSSFAFGKAFGITLGILAANFIPVELVPPTVWKRAMGIAVGAGKDASRARASALLPRYAAEWARVKDDGKAEAVLLALYGVGQRGARDAA
jgi:crossover junction endodeoxyribonuclease RuvC